METLQRIRRLKELAAPIFFGSLFFGSAFFADSWISVEPERFWLWEDAFLLEGPDGEVTLQVYRDGQREASWVVEVLP